MGVNKYRNSSVGTNSLRIKIKSFLLLFFAVFTIAMSIPADVFAGPNEDAVINEARVKTATIALNECAHYLTYAFEKPSAASESELASRILGNYLFSDDDPPQAMDASGSKYDFRDPKTQIPVGFNLERADGATYCTTTSNLIRYVKMAGFNDMYEFVNAYYTDKGRNYVLKPDFGQPIKAHGLNIFAKNADDAQWCLHKDAVRADQNISCTEDLTELGNKKSSQQLGYIMNIIVAKYTEARNSGKIKPMPAGAEKSIYLTDAAKFYQLRLALEAQGGCNASRDYDENAFNASSGTKGKIWIPDPNEPRNVIQVNRIAENNSLVATGYAEDKSDGKRMCATILSMLADKKYAQAYADTIKQDNPDMSKPVAGLSDLSAAVVNIGDRPRKDGGGSGPDCYEAEGSAISWFLCPVINGIDRGINKYGEIVDDTLFLPDNFYEKNDELRTVWAYARAIATFLLVGVGLIMVISQAIEIGPFDAYTIKKAFPRLVVGVILIQLSWFIFTTLIKITNDVGIGVAGLMYAPFGGSDSFKLYSLLQSTGGGAGLFTAAVIAGGAVAALAIGGMGIISLGATAALGLFLAFVLLAFRRMILIGLLMVAPVALVAWILPNTQKLWKIWWESFSKLLLMFPIITFMIASGRIFSKVAGGVDSNGAANLTGLTALLTIVFGYFGPYFLIPKTFQLAGSAFANIAGITNNRSRGAFDRLKNYRANKTQENLAKMKAGQRFSGRNRLTRGFNRATAGASSGFKGGFGFGERGRQAYDQTTRNAMLETMKSGEFQSISQNDDALMAATYNNAREAEEALTARFGGDSERARQAVAAVQASTGFGRAQALAAAQQMVSTGTGYKNMQDMTETLARASGGNTSTAKSLAGFANSEAKKVGRHDLAPSYGTLSSLVQQEVAAPGSVSAQQYTDATAKTVESSSVYELVNAKPQAIENAVEAHKEKLKNGTTEEKLAASTFFKELQSGAPNAKGGSRDAIMEAIGDSETKALLDSFDGQVPDPTKTKTVERRVEDLSQPNGYRIEFTQTPVTMGDVARERARTYQPPDPNRL